MLKLMGRFAVMAAAMWSLAACGSLIPGGMFGGGSSPRAGLLLAKDKTTLGLAFMAKGERQNAERHFLEALEQDPKNIYALLGQGLIYQNSGREAKAREMYEAILATHPSSSLEFLVFNNMAARPITDIAGANLALINSSRALAGMSQNMTGEDAGPPGPAIGVGGAANGLAIMGRAPVGGAFVAGSGEMALSRGDANILSRFKTLAALYEQGLITQEEFNTRRQANIGALLPLTSPPPAASLDRPAPDSRQISSRLKAIARALEMQAVSAGLHSSERTMILNALMPAAPVSVTGPRVPPQDLAQATGMVRRLDFLKAERLIFPGEYSRERQATIKSVAQPAGRSAPAVQAPPAKPSPIALKPQLAVHIASYRSKRSAEKGWAKLEQRYRALLGGLQHETPRTDLGAKGIYYRLKAGPLEDKAAAGDLCNKLESRGQFCRLSFMGVK